MLFKILGNTDFFVLEGESHGGGTVSKIHVVDGVRSTVAPVGNDDLLAVLCSDGCLPLFVITEVFLEFVNSV